MQSGQTVAGAPDSGVGATRVIASTLGAVAGMSGLDHGFFEALQGNASTHGVFVQAIGPAHRMWVYGTEDAFTVVPNFLISGILAIMVGALIVVWSVGFIDRKNGSRVFLGLGGLLFLVGGGVALVGFVALCWTVARRLGRTSTRSSAGPSGGVLGLIARMWAIFLAASVVLVAFALEIAISGFVPGVSNPDHVQLICWSSLAAMLFMLLLAILGGSLHDAQLRARAEMAPVPTR